jgi:hypothetical protein
MPGLYVLAAVLAIGSKFLIRVDGKHVFNPANFAIVALVMATGDAWVSPGQWGRETLLMFAFAGLGMLVLSRAKRLDVALTFLAAYAGLLLARAAYLGDPLTIPIQQLQSGALMLFTFFMITDPKTTPDHRLARVGYAAAVAAIAFALQYQAYMPVGIMYALFLAAPFVPLIDRATAHLGAPRFNWSRPTWCHAKPNRGNHATRNKTARRRYRRHGDCGIIGACDGLLRLLRRQGRRQAVQRGLESCRRPQGKPHRRDDGERLPRRPEGVRACRAGADRDQAQPDQSHDQQAR